ncbi:Efflux pump himE [Fulvia fulva]|nr:Efflux pump himE [Fulvia fulva]WPV15927.1 Efflux pump himE [Fulvia fulva]WPV30865.1 Efflux pump himE [Fulvia fulva]
MGSREFCTEVTPQCPVELTTYGYRPTLAGNSIILALFGICTIAQLALGIKHRLPAFASVVCIACALECAGYGGRLMMNDNPWSSGGFKLQIVGLILAPSFLAAGIYLTFKHLVIVLGRQYSRLMPRLYPWIFISCDFASIVLQAIGGGIAASETEQLLDVGNGIIIAGIAFQVATMGVCILLAVDFAIKLWKSRSRSTADGAALENVKTYTTTTAFYYYLGCMAVAFVTIFIRCIYRLPEMAGGWGNPLMRNEKEFLILDGAMVAIAAVLMTIAHPGIFFSEMRAKNVARQAEQAEKAAGGNESP